MFLQYEMGIYLGGCFWTILHARKWIYLESLCSIILSRSLGWDMDDFYASKMVYISYGDTEGGADAFLHY